MPSRRLLRVPNARYGGRCCVCSVADRTPRRHCESRYRTNVLTKYWKRWSMSSLYGQAAKPTVSKRLCYANSMEEKSTAPAAPAPAAHAPAMDVVAPAGAAAKPEAVAVKPAPPEDALD